MNDRNCEVCRKSQFRKKVWAKHSNKVICFSCASNGWQFWPDGSTYNMSLKPLTAEQESYLERSQNYNRGSR